MLENWNGCLLLVSHDRPLLDRMDRILELDRGEVRSYGGNFTEYEAAVRAAREVAEKNVRNAEQEVKREKREMQQARERPETNNLDLVSVGQLESALNAYEGAFVAVSHDERFLVNIKVDRWLRRAEGRLMEIGAPDGD